METLKGGYNILAKPEAGDIYDKVLHSKIDWNMHQDYYGEGDATEKLVKILTGLRI